MRSGSNIIEHRFVARQTLRVLMTQFAKQETKKRCVTLLLLPKLDNRVRVLNVDVDVYVDVFVRMCMFMCMCMWMWMWMWMCPCVRVCEIQLWYLCLTLMIQYHVWRCVYV